MQYTPTAKELAKHPSTAHGHVAMMYIMPLFEGLMLFLSEATLSLLALHP